MTVKSLGYGLFSVYIEYQYKKAVLQDAVRLFMFLKIYFS